MTYKITRNLNLVDMPEQFTAKNWDSAVTKVTRSLQGNPTFLKYAREKKLNISNIASEMLVELGKDY
jgi:predicted secreted acid phosphatase